MKLCMLFYGQSNPYSSENMNNIQLDHIFMVAMKRKNFNSCTYFVVWCLTNSYTFTCFISFLNFLFFFAMGVQSHSLLHVFIVGRKNPCRFRMIYSHTPLYGFFRRMKKPMQISHDLFIHPCMGFFDGQKNPCRFCMIYSHTPLYGFFRRAKKTMQISHGLLSYTPLYGFFHRAKKNMQISHDL
jgi:hypothetical protein